MLLQRDGELASVRVRDTGVGIRPEILGLIFEPFQQEKQDVARTTGGLGLGLAVARGMIELHHGELLAFSEGSGRGAPQQILIVEEHEDAAETLSALLRRRGHGVRAVTRADMALEVLRAGAIDIVLL